MNEQNLRPPFTPSEARENGKKGAAASVKSRRKKKSIAETANMVLNSTVTDPKQLAAIEKAGLPIPDKPTYKDFIVASIMLRTVQKGRIDDLEKLMDILGESPIQNDTETLRTARELLEGIDSAID